MKAIFSFKFFKDINYLNEIRFYNYARLAVASASKFYPTHLYCCEKGKYILTKQWGIKFDEITVLDELTDYEGNMYCYPKMLAMIKETKPYVHLDFDTYITFPLFSDNVVKFGHAEVFNNKEKLRASSLVYLNENYFEPHQTIFKKILDKDFVDSFDWNTIPNNSAVIVNSPDIVKTIYEKILVDTDDIIQSKSKTSHLCQYIEQFLLCKYLEYYNIDFDFIYHLNPIIFTDKGKIKHIRAESRYVNDELMLELLDGLKFVHFHGYRRHPISSMFVDKLYISKFSDAKKLY